jgi:class 3 adenylate cyclase
VPHGEVIIHLVSLEERVTLGAFVPTLVHEHLAANPAAATTPALETLAGALLLTDLTGFSTLAETLSKRGRRGAEDLKELLDRFFGRLVRIVHQHDGQIACFPGDAAVAIWPAGETDCEAVARTACACALSLHEQLQLLDATDASSPLRPRSAIGVGEMRAAHVGAIDRWHVIVDGDALSQVIAALAAAAPGEVVASPATWTHVSAHAQGRAGPLGVRLASIANAAMPRGTRVDITPASALLRPFVPRAVQVLIESGRAEWLAEFRRATILFVKIEVDDAALDLLNRLQRITTAIHRAVDHYGGSINQMVADEKGTVAVCGWGIVLHSHGDDALRAALAALRIARELDAMGIAASCGIATGDVFTGLRGTPDRCDYAMIGKPVNIAAHLMQAAAGDVLCDSASIEGAGGRLASEPLASVVLKGAAEPVPVHRLLDQNIASPRSMFGRRQEREQLRDRIDALAEHETGSVAVIEGDSGIGKSRILADAVHRAHTRRVQTIIATGDAIERSTPYHAWRTPLRTLLGLEASPTDASKRAIRTGIDAEQRLTPFAALLNPVLGVDFEESDESMAVTDRGRSLLTRDLLVRVCGNVLGEQPVLIVLDDTHWFDSASWLLADALYHAAPNRGLVIAMRPVPAAERPPELQRLLGTAGTLVVHLAPLSAADAEALACRCLGARALDPAVAGLVRDKAEGHPYFVEELANALRMRDLVVVERGVCRFASALAAAESSRLPNTVEVVISSRIDQLTMPQQLTVKVASVFGRSFTMDAVQAIYPIAIDEPTLTAHFEALTSHALFHAINDSNPPQPHAGIESQDSSARTFAFKHSITQEVAYGMLPYAQRRPLHAAAAAWYERTGPADADRLAPLLAHHWHQAQEPARAIRYLEVAGEQALRKFANVEAVRFYTDALAALDQIAADAPTASDSAEHVHRRLALLRRAGDAHANLGHLAEARDHLQRALATGREALPEARWQWVKAFGGELLTQLTHRLRLAAARTPSALETAMLREHVCAFERLGAVSYFTERLNIASYCVLAALNRAERLGPSPELALVYADAGNIVGMLALHRLAQTYNSLSQQTAMTLAQPVAATKARCRCAVLRIGAGDWSACADLEHAMALSDQFGDPTQWGEAAAIRIRAAHLRGEFQLALTLAREMRHRSASTGATAHQIWGLDGEAWALFYLGDHLGAIECAETGLSKLTEGRRGDRVPLLDFAGVLALARLHRGERDRSTDAVNRILEILAQSPRPGHLAVLGLAAFAEAATARWEDPGQRGAREEAARLAHRACGLLKGYSRINPSTTARALLWAGCAAWLAGSGRSAHAHWRAALARATAGGLPYDAARAHVEIARHLPAGDPARGTHLARAEAGFEAMGARFDLQRATSIAR